MPDLMIDRIAPTQRPGGRNAGTQRWESLLFCHWEVDPQVLRDALPRSLELDQWQGRGYLGVVPFKMRRIRPPWLPARFAFNFYETNVRTYVTHQGRPGVYFFSLDASSRLAVIAARLGWSLPYFNATMSSRDNGDSCVYESRRSRSAARHRVEFRRGEHLGVSQPDTLEFFLFERYLLFVERRRAVFCGQVHHSPYDVWNASVDTLEDTLVEAAGLPSPDRLPDLCHYCPGVDVEVFSIEKVETRERGDGSIQTSR